ncbi:cadherin repeat domain-containing protein [Altererythrobacter lutimaris]|uniref:Cadherin repeat domain-containing protein n=1 Tax=Altererythrobacter lutimaris TaxID=2743979 RepID=A0A850HEZ8_9SPHN|nr:cadherin repeat domain-containing protein [Altererythrobacter lutimaris]NVE95726.1 cadherin repeat domain-containing protein [Altererythrobacter lutimaris]
MIPTDPVRTTAKPAIRLIVPPNQHFTDELLVGFSAWANNEGTLLDRNGLSHVRVTFEGNTHEIPAPSLRAFQDANGEFVAYRAWWIRLKRPDELVGEAHLYAEAVPADPALQSRAIGPFAYTLTDNEHDFEWTVDPDNAAAPQTSSDISEALHAAWQAGANNPLITVGKTGRYSVADVVIGAAYVGTGYATITAADGVAATIGYDGDTTGHMRSKYDRLRFKGANVILDMSSIEVLFNEGLGDHWLDGCNLLHTDGHISLWNGTTRNGATAVRNSPWFTEATFEGIDSPVANANLVRGCKANNCYNDFAAQPRCLIGNTVINHDSSFFRTHLDALTISYSGSGSATLSSLKGGAGSNAYRRFIFRVEGNDVASYDSLTANWESDSGTYWVSDLVDFINQSAALADWAAILHDDTRQAGHVGVIEGRGFTFDDEPVGLVGTTFQTFIDLHSDFSQMSSGADTENTIIEANRTLDFQGQIIWLSSNFNIKDCFYVNNTFDEIEDFSGFSQISRTGAKSHVVIAHNTLSRQHLLLRDGPLGEYSLIANNVFESFISDGPDIGLGVVKDNHIHASGTILAGATETVQAGEEADLFADANNENFSPSGALLSNMKKPVVAYDRLGAKRRLADAVGAQSSLLPEPVAMLSELGLAHDKVSEAGAIGHLVSTIIGTSIGSTLTLSDSAGGRFAISNGALVLGSVPLNFETAQSHNITIAETHGSAGNSPKETSFDITVLNVQEVALGELTLSAHAIAEGEVPDTVFASLLNVSAGSSLSLLDDAGGRFALTNAKLVTGQTPLDFESAQTHSIVVQESLPDAYNSPRETELTINVANAAEAVLNELNLSSNAVPENAQAGLEIGTFVNRTAGSILDLTNDADGRFSVIGDALTVNGPSLDYEDQREHLITVRETHSDAANSPRDTLLTVLVSNVGEIELHTLALSNAHVAENALEGSIIGTVIGQTNGATLTLIDSAGDRFALDGENITCGSTNVDFEENQSFQIVLRETHPEGANSPNDTIVTIGVGDLSEAPTTAEELAAALAGSTQSAFADLRQADDTIGWIATDLSGHGNHFTQAFATQRPVIDSKLGAVFSHESANNNIRYPISGGTFTALLAFAKNADDARGTPVSNGSGGPGRYQDGIAIALAGTCLVDGNQVTDSDALHDALDDGQEHIIEWQGIDASEWSEFVIGRPGDSLGGILRCVVVIDETTVADHALASEKANQWLLSNAAQTNLPEEPDNTINYQMTLSGSRDGELGIDPDYWHDVAALESEIDTSLGNATHRSVRSGNWSSASTWDGGTLPTAGSVVEIRHEVVYDIITPIGTSNVGQILAEIEDDSASARSAYASFALKGVVVQTGARLRFDPSVQTFLLTENLFALSGSEVEIGHAGNPVLDSGLIHAGRRVPKAAIGLIGLDDPEASLRLGFVTMGKLRIWGEEKCAAVFVEDVAAGSQQLSFEHIPDRWNVGDRILIPGTAFTDPDSVDARYTGPLGYWGPERSDNADMPDEWSGKQHFATSFKINSQDEIRTITAITGGSVTLDSALFYNHVNHSDALNDGTPVNLRFPVQNLTRSICIFGFCTDEKGSNAHRRAHTMHMFHEDCVRKFAEFKDLGRSRIDASLFVPGQNDTASGLREAEGREFLVDAKNPIERYAVHDYWCGPFFGRRATISEGLAIHNSPGTVSPGRGYVQNHSRAHLKDCIVHGFRATGFSTELGSEIGQWENCYSSNCPGDGFIPAASGDHHELLGFMSGHHGTAFHNQARQVILRNCWAGSANSAFSWRQNHSCSSGNSSLQYRNLRYAHPVTMGVGVPLDPSAVSVSMEEGCRHLQAQIPKFDDNSCHDCEEGFVVSDHKDRDKVAVEPMTSQGIKLHAKAPYKGLGYAANYMFKDFYFKGPGSGVAIDIGTQCYNSTFANGRIADYTNVIRDAEFNYLGFLVDISHNSAQLQDWVEQSIGTGSIAAHPQVDIMGAWTVTGTQDGQATANLRSYEILEGETQLPSLLPGNPFNPGPANGSAVPRFELSASSGGILTPSGRDEVSIRGTITDRAGNRDWPSYQHFQSADANPVGDRVLSAITGAQIVERNGCWKDGQTWRTTLWFADADRVDHTPIQISVTCELSGFDANFLALNEVADAAATRPSLPLALEDLSWSNTPSVEEDGAPFTLAAAFDVPPQSFAICQSTIKVARLSAGRNLPISIVDGEFRINNGDWSGANTFVQRGDQIEVRAMSSLISGQTTTATLSIGSHSSDFLVTTWSQVSKITDDFEAYADGTSLEAQSSYQLVDGCGGAISVHNGALSVVSHSDWVQHTDDLARTDGLRFKARWGQGGGVCWGLAKLDSPFSSHFILSRHWDGSFRITTGNKTWVYPDCATQEVCVDLIGGEWTVTFAGALQAPNKDRAQILPFALPPTSAVMFMSPLANGTRHNTLLEFSVEHL